MGISDDSATSTQKEHSLGNKPSSKCQLPTKEIAETVVIIIKILRYTVPSDECMMPAPRNWTLLQVWAVSRISFVRWICIPLSYWRNTHCSLEGIATDLILAGYGSGELSSLLYIRAGDEHLVEIGPDRASRRKIGLSHDDAPRISSRLGTSPAW